MNTDVTVDINHTMDTVIQIHFQDSKYLHTDNVIINQIVRVDKIVTKIMDII